MQIISNIFTAYQSRHPDEFPGLQRLESLLQTQPSAQWIDRKNFVGHVTASGLVVQRETGHVLLIKHKALNRWLQPGGHIEPHDATPVDAAVREVTEEVGLRADQFTLLAMPPDRQLPLDIDSHFIPANPRKGEAEHYHHDFRYVFLMPGDADLSAQEEEVSGFRWASLEELEREGDLKTVAKKLRRVLNV